MNRMDEWAYEAERRFNEQQRSRIAQNDAQRRLREAAPDMLAMLEEVADYLDRYADVIDGDDGQPEANDAMRLLTAVTDVIASATGEHQ